MSALTEPITHPLTAIRVRRGWSQAKVAKIIKAGAVYPPGHRRAGERMPMADNRQKVYRYELGRPTPEMPAQYAIADELGVPHDVVNAHPWPESLLTVDGDEPVDAPWTPDVAGDFYDSVVSSALVDRRAFIGATAGALIAMSEAWSGAFASPARGNGRGVVTVEAVDHLQRRIQELWRLDDALGGGGCLDAGVADLRLVTRLIRTRRYDPEVGQRLHGLAGALARFCGWAAFDDGRLAAAGRFWHIGLRGAAASGDTGQGVYGLSNLALAAVYSGDANTALHLLGLARRHVDPSQRIVLSMLECGSSRAHAIRGDGAAAAAALNRGDDLWENRIDGADPEWIYWMPRPSQTAEASTALMQSGDYLAAERNLHDGLDSAGGCPGPRDRALYLARLSETLLRDGRLDEAKTNAHEAIDMVAGVASTRVRTRVNSVIDLIPVQEPARAELVDHRADAWLE